MTRIIRLFIAATLLTPAALSAQTPVVNVANMERATAAPPAALDSAIDTLRRARGRLLSVTPVRASLEDFFLEQLSEPAAEEVTQ